MLTILLFVLYSCRVITPKERAPDGSASAGGNQDATAEFLAKFEPNYSDNTHSNFWFEFPNVLAWPPVAISLSVPFQLLWSLLFEDYVARVAVRPRLRTAFWWCTTIQATLWLVAHALSWAAAYVPGYYVPHKEKRAVLLPAGVLMCLGVFGYYFALVVVSSVELKSAKESSVVLQADVSGDSAGVTYTRHSNLNR